MKKNKKLFNVFLLSGLLYLPIIMMTASCGKKNNEKEVTPSFEDKTLFGTWTAQSKSPSDLDKPTLPCSGDVADCYEETLILNADHTGTRNITGKKTGQDWNRNSSFTWSAKATTGELIFSVEFVLKEETPARTAKFKLVPPFKNDEGKTRITVQTPSTSLDVIGEDGDIIGYQKQ